MGWSSGGDVFNAVAQALIDGGASDELKRRVCEALAEELADADWDYVEESLERFAHDPVVTDALNRSSARSMQTSDDDVSYVIVYDAPLGVWQLMPQGENGVVHERPGTVAGHNELVDLWFAMGPDTAERRRVKRVMMIR